MKLRKWRKRYVEWIDGDKAYFSIPFTWQVKDVIKKAESLKYSFDPKKIYVGGPAAYLMRDKFKGIAKVLLKPPRGIVPITLFNKDATFTTRGCINKCKFCAVRIVEPGYRELKKWKPKPIISDNNLIASSKKHIFSVVDKLKRFPLIDFNGGFEAKLWTKELATKFSELKCIIRFGFDLIEKERYVIRAIEIAKKAGIDKNYIRIYVLYGYKDTIEETLYRCELVRKLGVHPFPMRYQPLRAENKNEYKPEGWDERYLVPIGRFYSKTQSYFRNMTFEEYLDKLASKKQKTLLTKVDRLI
jgi:radical SAM superfamily enzyme YgiQ (UPF0313 family)